MGKIYNFLGLSSGYINNDQSDTERKKVLRDLRTAVLRDADDISKKYILQNTTSNYVILYIASEKLIDLVDKIDDLRQECLAEKSTLILGPNTLAAFLDTIRVGHHYLKLNETASKVAKVVRGIQKEFSNFVKNIRIMEKALGDGNLNLNQEETRYRKKMLKVVIANHKIKKGSLLKKKDRDNNYKFWKLDDDQSKAVTGICLIFAVLFGIILDFIINRPLKGEPVFSIIMATISLAIILRSLTAMLAGPLSLIPISPFGDQTFVAVSYTHLTLPTNREV